MARIYWSELDRGDPVVDGVGCRRTLGVDEVELQALLGTIAAGAFDDVVDDAAAVEGVRRALMSVVAYDVRERIDVPRFIGLRSMLLGSSARALALARLVILRDVSA